MITCSLSENGVWKLARSVQFLHIYSYENNLYYFSRYRYARSKFVVRKMALIHALYIILRVRLFYFLLEILHSQHLPLLVIISDQAKIFNLQSYISIPILSNVSLFLLTLINDIGIMTPTTMIICEFVNLNLYPKLQVSLSKYGAFRPKWL